MTKTAQATVKAPSTDHSEDSLPESELLYLKEKKEAEIRMRLDQFATELAQARKERNQ